MRTFLEWLTGIRGTVGFFFCLACEGGTLVDWTVADAGQIAAWLTLLNYPNAAPGTYAILTISFGAGCVPRCIEPLKEMFKNLRRLLPKWRFGEKVDAISSATDLLRDHRKFVITHTEPNGYLPPVAYAELPKVEQAVDALRGSLKKERIRIPHVDLANDDNAKAMQSYLAELMGCAKENDLREARKLEMYRPETPPPPARKSGGDSDFDDEVPF